MFSEEQSQAKSALKPQDLPDPKGLADLALEGTIPGFSSVLPLTSGRDALAARLHLIATARENIELQYYIWRKDVTGTALLDAVVHAAERGVKVRILLDDWGDNAGDEALLGVDSNPNIEVRLFNPLPSRFSKIFGLFRSFRRSNRRMHNKAMIVDGRVAIIGGRNVGDEYFEQGEELDFGDLDLLTCGPVASEVRQAFELFWNFTGSHPVYQVAGRSAPLPKMPPSWKEGLADFLWQSLTDTHYIRDLHAKRLHFHRGPAISVADSPEKVKWLRMLRPQDFLGPRLATIIGKANQELVIVSPYFVPRRGGVKALANLRKQGTRVVIVTNSLAATDVPAVHAGYERYRRALLKLGVEIYEVRPDAWQMSRARKPRKLRTPLRSSLHAKTLVIDRHAVFVGSMNLDPRSILLNTENGVLVRDKHLGEALVRELLHSIKSEAYQVSLVGHRLRWTSSREGREEVFNQEPGISFSLRLRVRLLSLLPLEDFL